MNDWIKKVAGIVGIGGLILATVFITRWFSPKPSGPQTILVPRILDSTEVIKYVNVIDGLKRRNGILENLLKTREIANTSGGFTSVPPAGFMQPRAIKDSIRWKDSLRVVDRFYHAYDFPIAMQLTKNNLTVYTLNPFLQFYKSRAFKQYLFEREGNNFELTASETSSPDSLNGLLVYWKHPFLQWNGIYGEVGYGLNNGPWLSLQASVSVLDRVDILPAVRTSKTNLDAEIGVRFRLW